MTNHRVCSVEGCDKKYLCRGYCSMHYERKFRNRKRPGSKVIARHGAGLEFIHRIIELDTDECLIWPYGKDKDGYACVQLYGKSARAQRYVCTLKYGPPAYEWLESCHSCRNRACLNWRHLRWDTTKANAEDRAKDGTNLLGVRNFNNKLTPDQVKEIRGLYPSITLTPLAKQFGVSVQTIHGIVRRKIWRHV